MFDALSFTEIDGQHVELLPARTVLSLLGMGKGGGKGGGDCAVTQTGNQTNTQGGLIDVGVNALNNTNALNAVSLIPIGILGHGQC